MSIKCELKIRKKYNFLNIENSVFITKLEMDMNLVKEGEKTMGILTMILVTGSILSFYPRRPLLQPREGQSIEVRRGGLSCYSFSV